MAGTSMLTDSHFFYIESPDTKIVIEPIAVGIDNFLNYINNSDATLSGINIIIESAFLHPVDFRPRVYSWETMNLLNRIFFENGKYLLKNRFDTNFEILDFPNKDNWNLYDQLLVRKSFPLPNTLQKILMFPEGKILRKKFNYDESEITVEIAAYNSNFRHLNSLNIYSIDDPKSIQLFLIIVDVFRKIIKDIYSGNFNLISLHIAVLDVNFKSSKNFIEFRDDFYWSMKSLILDFNQIDQI